MPPIARIGSTLLVVVVAFASGATVGAQVLIPEPNDGPMTGVTRTWLDASRRAAPPTDRAHDSGSHESRAHASPPGEAARPPEQRTPSAPSFETPVDRHGGAGQSLTTAQSRAQSRTTIDPHVAPAARFEDRREPVAAPEGSDQEPKLLQASDAVRLRTPEELEDSEERTSGSPSTGGSGISTWVTVGSSLAVVLGLFFVFAWIVRRSGGRSMQALPKEAVEVLGRAPLVGRQHIHLIRCGNKIVLVAVSPEHVEPLAEITEPVEVDRLTGLCRRALPGSASVAFQKAFRDLEKTSA